MLKKLFSHTLIYGLAPQISRVAYFFALPFITSDLTELDFGVAGIMTAYTTTISVLSTLGLNIVLSNSFYHSPNHYKWGWRQIYGFLTVWNFVYAFILGLLLYFAVPKEAEKYRWLILLLNVSPLVFFGQTTVIGNLLYRVKQRPVPIALRVICFGLLNVILSVILIKYCKLGYMGWFWATFVSVMLSNLSYWYSLNIVYKMTPIFNYKWRYIKRALKVSLPTIPHYYGAQLIDSSDRMIMDFYKVDTESIGKYNFAYIFSSAFATLSIAVGSAFGPLSNELHKKKEDFRARNLVFVMQLFFFILTFFSSLWLKEVFQFVVKNEVLAQSYPIAIIVIMSQNYRPMYLGTGTKIMFFEKTNSLWKITFIAGIINVFLNLILIPVFGYKIATVTSFVAYMYMGYSAFYYKVGKELKTVNYYPLFWLGATILLTVLAYFMVELNWKIKMVITLCSLLIGVPFLYKYLIKTRQ
ncbi:MAG: lipopolysaccharide biosynthesis protein [Bacteroidia bacterium]